MWNKKLLIIPIVLLVILFWPRSDVQNGGERTRAELDLRKSVLYLPDSDVRFTGTLVDTRSKIAIHEGKADGISRGWHENGQLEVEETFVQGVSHGLRTRWHENGAKKSEAMIKNGQIVGQFVKWHDNGRKAAEVSMMDGKPHGIALAWHPSGRLKSRVELDHGTPGKKEFFPDTETIAQATP